MIARPGPNPDAMTLATVNPSSRPSAPLRISRFAPGDVIFRDSNEQPESGTPDNDGASFPFEIAPGQHVQFITCAAICGSEVTLNTPDCYALRDSGA